MSDKERRGSASLKYEDFCSLKLSRLLKKYGSSDASNGIRCQSDVIGKKKNVSIYFQESEKKMSLLTIPHSWLWLCHADSKRDRNEPNANGLLPSTNEVWGKVIFLSVIPSVHGGGGLASQHASQVT